MTGRATKNSTLKKIVSKAQNRTIKKAQETSALRSVIKQNQLLRLETQKRLIQIACGKALKEAGITNPKQKAEIHKLIQKMAQEAVLLQGTARKSYTANSMGEIEKLLKDPNTGMLFFSALTKHSNQLTRKTNIDSHLLK